MKLALAAFGPNGENWVQRAGGKVTCCCVTAFHRVGFASFGTPYNILCRIAGCGDGGLSSWNDAPGRTFADVKALFEKAIDDPGAAIL